MPRSGAHAARAASRCGPWAPQLPARRNLSGPGAAANGEGRRARHFERRRGALIAALGDAPACGAVLVKDRAMRMERVVAALRCSRVRRARCCLACHQWLLVQFPEWGYLRLFQYITFRAVMAAMTALLIGLAFGPWVIRMLTAMKIGQPIRGTACNPTSPSNTPTMGGVLILIGIGVSTLLWFDWSNRFVWVVMLVTFGFGAIGWVDDWRKVVNKEPRGHALGRSSSGRR